MVSNKLRNSYINKAVNKLADIVKENLLENNNIITRSGDSISAFKHYRIVKTENYSYNIYKDNCLITTVSSSRIALAWCIYDKHSKLTDATQLIKHENELIRRQSEMMHYRCFINSDKITETRRNITINRLDDAKDRYHVLQKYIDKHINIAKYFYQKG